MLIYLDHALRLQTSLQDVASRGMYGLLALNGFIFQYIILIMVLVGGLLLNTIPRFLNRSIPLSLKYSNYNVPLELF